LEGALEPYTSTFLLVQSGFPATNPFPWIFFASPEKDRLFQLFFEILLFQGASDNELI
jgi:hypothetical protein